MSDGGSRRYAWCMPRSEDDAVAGGPAGPSRRALVVAGGFVLAAAATLAVFLTDNPQYLRIAGRWQDHVLFQVLAPAMPE